MDRGGQLIRRIARRLVRGRRPAPEPPRPAPRRKPYGTVPGPPLPPVENTLSPDDPWIHPPVAPTPGHVDLTDRVRPRSYDLELLEQLNEEYRDKPLVAAPREFSEEALAADAQRRVRWAHNMVDLSNQTVLEVGCGGGYETWSIAHNLGSDAYGVDITAQESWSQLEGERVHFAEADLTEKNIYEENTFDRIISYTVWEHVVHPHKLLEETYKILKPGGLQWLRANLWAGPRASHRYRDIYFPWPHHLFSDDVINEWDRKNGREPEGSWWVNKLTWNHYERYIHDVGFRLRKVQFQTCEWDEEFYQRFHDILGRIPRTDLERDFFLCVLEKPA